MKVQLPDAS